MQVVELIPPCERKGLTGDHQVHEPLAMPLHNFIAEAGAILETNPNSDEIMVEGAKMQCTAEFSGEHDAHYKNYNDTPV